jgi:hypothetical protein
MFTVSWKAPLMAHSNSEAVSVYVTEAATHQARQTTSNIRQLSLDWTLVMHPENCEELPY